MMMYYDSVVVLIYGAVVLTYGAVVLIDGAVVSTYGVVVLVDGDVSCHMVLWF